MTSDTMLVRDLVLAGAAGIAIAAACGLRAFLPLLALGLGVRFGLVHVDPSAAWIGSTPALVSLVWAALLEIVADKIPALDHLLDLAGTLVRPAAAMIAGWCTFRGVHPAVAAVAAVLLGAGTSTSGGCSIANAIARAIAKRPDVLLCDEPTGALDVTTGKIVLTAIAVVWMLRRVFRPPHPRAERSALR